MSQEIVDKKLKALAEQQNYLAEAVNNHIRAINNQAERLINAESKVDALFRNTEVMYESLMRATAVISILTEHMVNMGPPGALNDLKERINQLIDTDTVLEDLINANEARENAETVQKEN